MTAFDVSTDTSATTLPPLPAQGPRELRAQSIQRLQVGVFGLAAMLLLVGLANIITDRARLSESTGGAQAAARASASSAGGTDPLADLGVIPAADAGSAARQHPANRQPNH
jgi:hypothetical protein